jgi:hypothetical protein
MLTTKYLCGSWPLALGTHAVLGHIRLPAFLKGREIGDSIFAAQLLGSAWAAEQLPGAAVILDIAKAYDTVDRSFLFRIMEAAGCGRPMLRWVQLLLSDTRAYTVVNSHVSKAQVWQAGVRQGCPLSPLL